MNNLLDNLLMIARGVFYRGCIYLNFLLISKAIVYSQILFWFKVLTKKHYIKVQHTSNATE